ncbi:stage III sporulation protein AE [Porcipelethomonas sp.]|uniref:stage III sporulation protein AE n=1 Tax=Porcipelethomonas sp. TaxID=2981675 RepID=UPI003EF8834D
MKKIILILIMFLSFSMPVCADEFQTDELYEASGASGLSAGEILEENGISFEDPESILNLNPSKIWNIIKEIAENKITQPLKLFASLFIVIILTALIDGTSGTIKNKGIARIYELICVLVCVAVLSVPVCSCMEIASTALEQGAEFMMGFVPVFAGVAAAGGHITSASGYNLLVLGFSDVAIQIAGNFFMPVLSMCISLAIVDAACDAVSLDGILNGIKKIVTWGLGFIMTIFTGLLSIQSIVGSSADTLSVKAAKYVISNSVPVVGGAASDAYTTVRGSLVLLKNGIGGVGITALVVMLLPSLILLFLYKISFSVLGAAAEVFGTKKLMQLFKNINSVLSTAIGIVVCFTLMFIISTAIIMTVCTNI